jgi:hypothetical protein
MIVNDFDIKGITVPPLETDAPLIIHSNAMLPASIFPKAFQGDCREESASLPRRRRHPKFPVADERNAEPFLLPFVTAVD